jgi:HEAT repeat protein
MVSSQERRSSVSPLRHAVPVLLAVVLIGPLSSFQGLGAPTSAPKRPTYKGLSGREWVEKALSEDVKAQEDAYYGLGKLQEWGLAEDALPPLLRALGDKRADVRARAAAALSWFGRGPEGEAQASRAITALEGKDLEARYDAVRELRALSPASRRAAPFLGKALKGPDPFLRFEAALALVWLMPDVQAHVPALLRALKEKPPSWDHWDRRMVGRALARMRPAPEAAIPWLREALRDETVWARSSAAFALGRMGPAAKPAAADLRKALSDEEVDVRAQAAVALWRAEGKAGPSLPTCLAALRAWEKKAPDPAVTPDDWVVMEVLRALGEMGPAAKEAIPILRRLQGDANEGVRWRAWQALQTVGAGGASRSP